MSNLKHYTPDVHNDSNDMSTILHKKQVTKFKLELNANEYHFSSYIEAKLAQLNVMFNKEGITAMKNIYAVVINDRKLTSSGVPLKPVALF